MNKLLFFFLAMMLQFNVVQAQREVMNLQKREPGQKGLEQPAYLSVRREEPKPVTPEDFLLEAPGESAIYLANNGYSKVFYDFRNSLWRVSTKKTIRIKILAIDGLELGNVKIPVFHGGEKKGRYERIREIKAATYHLNDLTGLVDSAVLVPEEIYKTDLMDNWEEVSFALPNVQVNSIIDISYITDSPSLTRLDDWNFQKNHPIKKSWFTIVIDGPCKYAYAFQGHDYLTGALTNDEQGIAPLGRLRPMEEEWWYAENIPAYKEEPFSTSKEDCIPKLSFQFESAGEGKNERTFLRSWDEVAQGLKESKRFEQFYTGQKNFTSQKSVALPSLATARFEYEEFKRQFKWDDNYGVYPNVTYHELMSKKSGNSSSLGLALYQRLKQSGFNAELVLLSPRFNGKINRRYPFADRFIAAVVRLILGGKAYLLDPVNDVPFGQLGEQFLNGDGLILSDEVAWQNLTVDAEDYRTSQVNIMVSGEKVEADIQLNLRKYGVIPADTDPEELFKSDWEITEMKLEDAELTAQRLTAKIDQEIEDEVILVPLSFDRVVFSENPFKENERLYPIEFLHQKKYSYKLEIQLSDDYEFDSFPKSEIVKTSDGKLSAILNVNRLGQKLNLIFLFWTKTNTFDVAYYPYLQSAYQLMAELAEGSIIVKRKS